MAPEINASKAAAWPGGQRHVVGMSATAINPVKVASAAIVEKVGAVTDAAQQVPGCSAFAISACRPGRNHAVLQPARPGLLAAILTGACAVLRVPEHARVLAVLGIKCAREASSVFRGTVSKPRADSAVGTLTT